MTSFDDYIECLNALMLNEFVSANLISHPLMEIMQRGNHEELLFIVQQYSIFPKVLVRYTQIALETAMLSGWDTVVSELRDNIAEEMGSSTQGISHYDYLANGLELGLNVPIKSTMPSKSTQRLLMAMDEIFNKNNAYCMGATYAIEATSIPELTIVRQLIDLLMEGAFPKTLRYFFDMHLNEWEPEHEEDLRKSISNHILEQDYEDFYTGFCAVLSVMDAWWFGLTTEVLTQKTSFQFASIR